MNLLLRVLYLACSDLESDGEGIVTIYQKRRSVETYYKTLKSHAALDDFYRVPFGMAQRDPWAQSRCPPTRLYFKAARHALDELQLLQGCRNITS